MFAAGSIDRGGGFLFLLILNMLKWRGQLLIAVQEINVGVYF
jgi:hypothetical protein